MLFSALLTAVLPQGKTSELIKSISRLACLVAILSPILYFFAGGELFGNFFEKTVIQTDDDYIRYCSEIRIENAENSLENDLMEQFALSSDVSIQWSYSEEERGVYSVEQIKIDKIFVYIEESVADSLETQLEHYIMTSYQCPTEVCRVS